MLGNRLPGTTEGNSLREPSAQEAHATLCDGRAGHYEGAWRGLVQTCREYFCWLVLIGQAEQTLHLDVPQLHEQETEP